MSSANKIDSACDAQDSISNVSYSNFSLDRGNSLISISSMNDTHTIA